MNKFLLLGLLLVPAIGSCSTKAYHPAARHTPSDMEAFLQPHNAIRSQHGLPALKWSAQLAGYARQWADHLQQRNNCNMKHRPRRGRFAQQYGENLFWTGARRWSDGRIELQTYSPEMVTHAWADEMRDFHYPGNRCRPGKVCGHYTQIVWRDTREIGCARAVCRDLSQIWVCNYNPPGNYIGEKPY
ncbi:MAG: CAP domain-containing protein [Pseudomonadota bacterium]